MSKQELIPEAVASVTYSVQNKDGFGALVTFRADTAENLLKLMLGIEPKLSELGYSPQARKSGGYAPKPKVVAGVCPKCGGNLLAKTSKTGKNYKTCENGKYDFTTKQTIGCDHIEWEMSDSGESATDSQANLIKNKFPDKWTDGLTKAQASEIIKANL